MVYSISIMPPGWRCDAPDSMPVLEAVRLAGFRLPASCRNGTCRACMCRLQSGRVAYRIEWPGLSAEEKIEAYILPCVAYPQADLVIEGPLALERIDHSS